MNGHKIASIIAAGTLLWGSNSFGYDCSGLPEWKRQHYYSLGDEVQYQETAYVNMAEHSKRDRPDPGLDDPWDVIGVCTVDDGGGGGGGGGGGTDPWSISIYGVWHCGNSFCDWSRVRDMTEFDQANHWIIAGDGNGGPAVNLVVLSFIEPMVLLNRATGNVHLPGLPVGMTREVVDYFKDHGISVLLSMGGVTYADAWNQALVTDPEGLAMAAVDAVTELGADGLEIDWENGRPTDAQMAGIETFIDTYNAQTDAVLTLDLAVGTRYLQELSRRAAADWLPNRKIDYINAMVPRGEPSTDQWQEHVDGKTNYDPPILPKAPAKIAVSLWLTDGRQPNANCVDFDTSSQLAKSGYVSSVQPNGEGMTAGFLGYMFWAAECPSSRNVCTVPPNGCEGGMGTSASYFDIPIPLDFETLRTE